MPSAQASRQEALEARVEALQQLVLALLIHQRNDMAMWNSVEAVEEISRRALEASRPTPVDAWRAERADAVREVILNTVQGLVSPEVIAQWQQAEPSPAPADQ